MNKSTSIFLITGTLVIISGTAQTRDHLYGAIENTDLLQCENYHWRAQRNEASNCYRNLLSQANAPEIRAEAMWAIGDIQGANALFQSAVESSPNNPNIRLRWGELFTQTYQYQEAYSLFEEALEIEPDNAYAHIGAAYALSQSGNTETINLHINAVMENSAAPAGAKLRAMIMAARSAMRQDQYDKAKDALTEAKQFANTENLPSMELSALEAALAFMTRQPYQALIDAALLDNPAYGDAYAIMGYFSSITRLYVEAGEFYQQAISIQPNH